MNHVEGHALIGKAAWNALVAHAGGVMMDIPARIESGSGRRLAELAGEGAAEKLIGYAAGDRLYIASGWEITLYTRYEEIISLHKSGLSSAAIARKFEYKARYSERNIRMIIAGRFDLLREALSDQYDLPGI